MLELTRLVRLCLVETVPLVGELVLALFFKLRLTRFVVFPFLSACFELDVPIFGCRLVEEASH